MKRLLALLAVAALTLAACGDDGEDVGTNDDPGGSSDATEPGTAPSGDDPLDGLVVVLAADDQNGLVEGTEVRLTFEAGTLGISAGCNQMSGGYTVEGDTLTAEPLAGTQMACDQPLMDQDARFSTFFAEPVTWALDGDDLVLTGPDDETLTFTDVAVASPDAELVGPTWTLDTLFTGEGETAAASSVPAGVTATLTFADDGTYQVDTGCNTGQGAWTTPEGGGPSSYEVEPPATTRMACKDDGASEVEAAMLAALDGLVTMEISEQRMTLLVQGEPALGFTTG